MIKGVIIPHADIKYAGDARKSAFKCLKSNFKYIIYLAALHKINYSNDIYLIHKDKGFPTNNLQTKPINYSEHSFKWVYKEVRTKFPNGKILSIGPNLGVSKDLSNWIINFMKKHKSTVLIATTDLIHYAKANNNYLSYPQQSDKVNKEENLISALVSTNISTININNILTNNKLTCGPKAISVFIRVMKHLGYTGKVVDYYDSYGSQCKDLLDRYTIRSYSINTFVSYVSIVYGININQNRIINFDIMLAIGILKSAVKRDVANKDYILRLPKWSPFYKRNHGIFVGTSINNNTNCSYGRYENSTNTSKKISDASSDCYLDAKDRWQIPYTKYNVNKMDYKVELLQSKNKWKEYPGYKALEKFKMDGKHGMFLQLQNGRGATYLPIVAKEFTDWTIEDYMNSLTRKAGGYKDDWKKGIIKIYRTISYTWNTGRQKLEIF